MGKRGLFCDCLRCREVGAESHLVESAELVERRRALPAPVKSPDAVTHGVAVS